MLPRYRFDDQPCFRIVRYLNWKCCAYTKHTRCPRANACVCVCGCGCRCGCRCEPTHYRAYLDVCSGIIHAKKWNIENLFALSISRIIDISSNHLLYFRQCKFYISLSHSSLFSLSHSQVCTSSWYHLARGLNAFKCATALDMLWLYMLYCCGQKYRVLIKFIRNCSHFCRYFVFAIPSHSNKFMMNGTSYVHCIFGINNIKYQIRVW